VIYDETEKVEFEFRPERLNLNFDPKFWSEFDGVNRSHAFSERFDLTITLPALVRNFACQTFKIRKVSLVVMGS
jgi:hypothetical protein